MAVSVLLLYTSGQIGSTYGGFSSTAETAGTIGFCQVFPESVKQLLNELKDHLNAAAALKASLKGYTPQAGVPGISGVESMSLEELEIAEQEISRQMAELQSDLTAINGQTAANNGIWNGIHAEISAAAAVLVQIGGYMIDLDPNCLEIKDEQFFNELQSSVSQSGVLSESFSASITGIVSYLRAIQNNTAPSPLTVNEAVYNQLHLSAGEPLQSLPILTPFIQPPGDLSNELISSYEQLEVELNRAREAVTADISGLQLQQQLLSQTRSKRLEELEKARQEALEQAKKDEEAKLGHEKQQKEKEKEKENEEKAQTEPKPTPEASPAATPIITPEATPEATPTITPETTPEPEAIPAGASGEPPASTAPAPAAGNPITPPDGDVIKAPSQEPQATEPPIPGPVTTALPSEPQLIKGGN
ncbi:hypothetical protein [Paenibacillus jilunlii]|uniref:Uncharacterized protein n=1 Tax=Paenibacillus jilunlii TaxID=682956 RepID=A0A1G9IQD6_9BACL|nr:hypothetical protein [Paenibacillus jilunlii]KWX72735.1 hypothetical protein AML91_19965 [Paenibacillus jilunlii]SDL27468.1 hypothetical protein SAMN05216191_102157 [Paenibacillus jilunlii]